MRRGIPVFAGLIVLLGTLPSAMSLAQDTPAQPVYTYNAQGQIALATYPNGAQLAYSYDANGNLQSVIQITSPTDPAAQ